MGLDLTNPKGVQAYLEQTVFAGTNVVPLRGGYANFTYRTTLRKPHVALGSNTPIKTLIIKHTPPYMAAWKETPFAAERQEFECLALKLIPKLVAPSSIIEIPELFYEDRDNRVMLMTDHGPDSCTLSQCLKNGPLSDSVAHSIGTELGVFLARLHTITRDPASGTAAHKAKTAFAENFHGGALVGSEFYGKVMQTVTHDSPLNISPGKLAKLDAVTQKAQARIGTSTEVLIMGDFRPGNFLLLLEPEPRVMIIDWEIARTGFPGMDVGHFLGELLLLRWFYPASRECIDILVDAFVTAYRAILLDDGHCTESRWRLAETARDAAMHIGTYEIALAQRLSWGGAEQTLGAVREGVEYILRSVDKDETWMRGSIVGGLLV